MIVMIDTTNLNNQTWSKAMNEPKIEQENFKSEETPQERYNALVDQFVLTKGWSKRKARRYLDAFAKRENARIIKEGKARQEKLRKEGKLIDTQEDRFKMEEEFKDQLKEAGINLEEESNYNPPTSDF